MVRAEIVISGRPIGSRHGVDVKDVLNELPAWDKASLDRRDRLGQHRLGRVVHHTCNHFIVAVLNAQWSHVFWVADDFNEVMHLFAFRSEDCDAVVEMPVGMKAI